MDEMDYVMHSHDTADPPGQQQQPQQQQQQQPSHQYACPFWRDHLRDPSNRNSARQYDPVNNSWNSQPLPSLWAPPIAHSPPQHSRPRSDPYYAYAIPPVPAVGSSSQAPRLLVSDSGTHFPYHFHPQPAANRFGQPFPVPQANSVASNRPSSSSDRSHAASSSSRPTLPPLNPPQFPQQHSSSAIPEEPRLAGNSTTSGSSLRSSFPAATSGPLPLFTDRSHTRSATPSTENAAAGASPMSDSAGPVGDDSQVAPVGLATPPTAVNNERRRPGASRTRREADRHNTQGSDLDSEDGFDLQAALDVDERQAVRLIEQFSAGSQLHRADELDEAGIRAHQLLRGRLNNKKVASKSAIASLLSVEIADLPENEKTCVICYNEFGVSNPEGINEAPLRLPRCKHVFGDHCIKKWFEESDSCPYCRDKLPSEPQYRANFELIREFLRGPYAQRHFRSTNEIRVPGPAAALFRDPYARAMAPRGDEGRHDDGPPRGWQFGDHWPPGSDISDVRRRPRPRRGSLRAAVSNVGPNMRPGPFTAMSPSQPPHQGGVIRERFPLGDHHPHSHNGSNGGRHILPIPFGADPLSLGASSMSSPRYPTFLAPPPPGNSSLQEQSFPGTVPIESPPTDISEYRQTIPPFFNLPPVNPADSMGFSAAPNAGSGYPPNW